MDPTYNVFAIDNDYRRLNVRTDSESIITSLPSVSRNDASERPRSWICALRSTAALAIGITSTKVRMMEAIGP